MPTGIELTVVDDDDDIPLTIRWNYPLRGLSVCLYLFVYHIRAPCLNRWRNLDVIWQNFTPIGSVQWQKVDLGSNHATKTCNCKCSKTVSPMLLSSEQKWGKWLYLIRNYFGLCYVLACELQTILAPLKFERRVCGCLRLLTHLFAPIDSSCVQQSCHLSLQLAYT